MMKHTRVAETLRPAILAVALGLCGCNTLAGFGKDIQAAGHAMTNSAERRTPPPEAAADQ